MKITLDNSNPQTPIVKIKKDGEVKFSQEIEPETKFIGYTHEQKFPAMYQANDMNNSEGLNLLLIDEEPK